MGNGSLTTIFSPFLTEFDRHKFNAQYFNFGYDGGD